MTKPALGVRLKPGRTLEIDPADNRWGPSIQLFNAREPEQSKFKGNFSSLLEGGLFNAHHFI